MIYKYKCKLSQHQQRDNIMPYLSKDNMQHPDEPIRLDLYNVQEWDPQTQQYENKHEGLEYGEAKYLYDCPLVPKRLVRCAKKRPLKPKRFYRRVTVPAGIFERIDKDIRKSARWLIANRGNDLGRIYAATPRHREVMHKVFAKPPGLRRWEFYS